MMDPSATLSRSNETTIPHTRLLKCGLAPQESAMFWQHGADLEGRDAPEVAAGRYWFGVRSERRLRDLLSCLRLRFVPFPKALSVLATWRMEPRERALICHWHVQLTDPTYRAFTGAFLFGRRAAGQLVTHRHAVQWIEGVAPDSWSATTRRDLAGRLLSTAAKAGLVGGRQGKRELTLPSVSDGALGYILNLLRDVEIKGDLLNSPYLCSVGLDGPALGCRLGTLPGLDFHRVADVTALEWHHADLISWADATGLPGRERSE